MTDTAAPAVAGLRPPLVVSAPDLVAAARRVRALQRLLEWAVAATVVGSLATLPLAAAATGPLRAGGAVAFALMLARALAIGGLRERLGEHRVALHASRRWLVVEPPADTAVAFTVDLRDRALPRGPLLLPGLGLLGVAVLQLLPVAGGPLTTSPEATRRGIAAVLALLLLHEAAAAAFADRAAAGRFRGVAAGVAAGLAVVTLAGRAGPLSVAACLLLAPITTGLLLAGCRRAARQGGGTDAVAWTAAGLLFAATISWLGLQALGRRDGTTGTRAAATVGVQLTAASPGHLRWLAGYGVGAAPPLPGPGGSGPAGSDWTRLLYEAGVLGVIIALGGALAGLRAARGDPWLLAALGGVSIHGLVDSGLHAPAVAALFVVVAALGQDR